MEKIKNKELYLKKDFQPTPLISPIYGIINSKNNKSSKINNINKEIKIKAKSEFKFIDYLNSTYDEQSKQCIKKEIPITSKNSLISTKNKPIKKSILLPKILIDEEKIKSMFQENTLIISKDKIILPFTINEIQEKFRVNFNNIEEVQQIINTFFTVSTSSYKHKILAKCMATFNLMRKREKKSIFKTFSLCIEVILNVYIYPAIITACKNSDELEIYLDCLEKNELNQYPCFKIIYDC